MREHFDNDQSSAARRERQRRADLTARLKKDLSRNAPCEHIVRAENGVNQHGFSYLDDDGDWKKVWMTV